LGVDPPDWSRAAIKPRPFRTCSVIFALVMSVSPMSPLA
jgi:hypothetical protein